MYYKAYTRDTGLIIQQAWIFGFETLYKKLKGQKSAYPMVIDFVSEGTIEIWQHKELEEELSLLILDKNKNDVNFFNKNLDTYISELPYYEKFWKQKHADSSQELKEFVKKLNKQVERYILYYFTLLNKKSPKKLIDIATEFRKTDEFWAKTSKFLRNSLIHLYPETKGYEDTVLQKEVSKIPIKEILENRKKGFVVLKNGNFIGKYDDLPYQFETFKTNTEIIKGRSAFLGKVQGEVFILKSIANSSKIKEGQILVSPMTTPDMMLAMQKCGAIVTDEGGLTCHAAIVARELKKPCIIGTKIATKVLKDGDLVEVDAEKGIVRKI
ncbi:MAG: phosphoenolpyruvate synthase [Candidatus Taylorbacteria bacterium]|nr:phosphoenolpyruvate synthase [Candidatus Taylorbacteria bacterium]